MFDVHDAVHDAFMTLPPYASIREGEVHELGLGVRKGSRRARSDPLSGPSERIERECPATSAEGQQVRAPRGILEREDPLLAEVNRRHERSVHLRIVVDLTRCQSYGQCVFLAPKVFRFHGEEALEYDYAPDDQLREQVRWAAAACPVHAITLDYLDEQPETVAHPERVGGKA